MQRGMKRFIGTGGVAGGGARVGAVVELAVRKARGIAFGEGTSVDLVRDL